MGLGCDFLWGFFKSAQVTILVLVCKGFSPPHPHPIVLNSNACIARVPFFPIFLGVQSLSFL